MASAAFQGGPRVKDLLSPPGLLPAYWFNRLSRERAILLFFAFVIGVCGSAAQYLTWLVPFAIVSADLAFAALYNLFCAITLLLYYQAPGMDGRNLENLSGFLPLRRFAWLAPSMTNPLWNTEMVYYGADGIVPWIAIAFFAFALIEIPRARPAVVTQ